MNPLGGLPSSSSAQFSLNKIDWLKLERLVLVECIALALALAPKLTGYSYVWNGTDYTAEVVLVVNVLTEAGRRWLAGQPKPA